MFNKSYKMRITAFFGVVILALLLINTRPAWSAAPFPGTMDADTIAKFQDPLYIMPFMNPALETNMHIGMYPIQQQYHKDWPLTDMWGYGIDQAHAHSPANTIVGLRGVPNTVSWTNNLVDEFGNFIPHPIDVDQTIPWADPYGLNQGPGKGGQIMTAYKGPVPTVVHLHGGEVDALSDGHYEAWFTPDCINSPTFHGPSWECTGQTYNYINEQKAATIWFHDHAFGMDRMNVMMGLFGGYVIIDPHDGIEYNPALSLNGGGGFVPTGNAYDIPLVVQDRMLYDGTAQIAYLGTPTNPDVHPIWFPEFFGNINVVNGKIWPYKDVEARKYRLRFIDGANARFYHVYWSDGVKLDANEVDISISGLPFDHYRQINMPFLQIATEGGFMANAVQVYDFLMAPAERPEMIVDFGNVPGGLTDIYLVNDAPGPYSGGDPVDQNTGMIMKFHITGPATESDAYMAPLVDGAPLENVATLTPTIHRNVILFEKEGIGGPLAMYLDGVDMSDPRSIWHPVIGTTEQWDIINTTMDWHPMHWHLIQLQILNRQQIAVYDMNMNIDPLGYLAAYKAANPILPIPYDAQLNQVDPTPYLVGPVLPPNPNEVGAWKDTWQCPSAYVTRVLARWAPQDGGDFSFDASEGPGYVMHCHILEHEENAMMREVHPIKAGVQPPATNQALWLDAFTQQAIGPVNYTNMMPMMDHWTDKSGTGNNAYQPDMDKMPMHDSYGYHCKEGSVFMIDPSYGKSDFYNIPYSSTITSANPDPMTPVAENKTLFVLFELIMDPMMLPPRQTVFEAGGTTAGYNIYIDNGKLLFGMWNRLERKYVMFDAVPLAKEKYYLAMIEYDAATKKYRASLLFDGNTYTSPLMDFQGLSQNLSECGIGAEVNGTRYHDYAMGNSWGNPFDGDISEIMLYNAYDPLLSQQVIDYLQQKYFLSWPYTTNPSLKEGWITFEDTEAPTGGQALSAYPSPFSDKSQVSVTLTEKQPVRLEVYNSMGQVAQVLNTSVLPAGVSDFTIDGANLTPGMYIIRATGNGFTENAKVVYVK